MAKQYKVTRFRKAVNRTASVMARLGKGPSWELTVTGRRSGEPRTVPVTPVDLDEARYLVAPYGAVAWVHNIRAAGEATLRRGGSTDRITVTEVDAQEAGPVLAVYFKALERIVGAYFDVPKEPTVEDFIAVADNHPVFRVN
mgnify:FL=1